MWLGGLALVAGAVVALRGGTAPPQPRGPDGFLADRVEHVPGDRSPRRPADLVLTSLDGTSLRAAWTAAGGVAPGGFEVRWAGRTRLVQATETELTDLPADAGTAVEVRAVDERGRRSPPAVARATPAQAHDRSWTEHLARPPDALDGPAALGPRRWRVLAPGDDCLGLRPLNGRRLAVTCDALDLQSNVPLRLGAPAADGAVGRVVLTTDGPGAERGAEHGGELLVALLPEPFHDLPRLVEPFPPGSVVLRVTPHGVSVDAGAGVPPTSRVVPVGGTAPPPTPGVRHRWELRVLPDAVVALRDGEALAAAAVAVPWAVARPRLAFRGAGAGVDAFGVGGVPEEPVPTSVVRLDPGRAGGGAVDLGSAAAQHLAGGRSVRVVASVSTPDSAVRDVPVTIGFGGRTAPGVLLPPVGDGARTGVVRADFPLTDPVADTPVRLTAAREVLVGAAHLVVDEGPAADRRPLPRMTDRGPPAVRPPAPVVTVVPETGPADRVPPGGRARVVVELAGGGAREVAAVAAVEVDLDGQRLAVLPTGGAAGGRHELLVDLAGEPAGRHAVAVRVLPVDQGQEVRTDEHPFGIGGP